MRGRAGGGFRLPGGRLGLGGIVVLLILSLVFKRNFLSLAGIGGPDSTQAGPGQSSPEEDKLKEFITFVLNDVQPTWATSLTQQPGTPYQRAHLVLLRDAIESACGFAEAATGPFYCPEDHKVYIDLGFYQERAERFGAPGDFAQIGRASCRERV